ncbi:MAG: DUF4358 domain-containing protein, partial [Clostridia bacterium]|nr:DUF4358 domain-containing protein [Clostridia bacterium]
MRRKTVFAAGILILILLLAGCAGGKKAGDAAAIYSAMENTGVLPSMIPMTADELYDLTGIAPEDYADASCHEAADGLIADEVLLFTAADSEAAKRIEDALRARLDSKAAEAEGYSPEQYAVIKKGLVLRNGLELCLIVSPEAAKLQSV